MKKFEEPVVEIVHLDANDVICTSVCAGYSPADNTTETDCLVD